MNPTSSDGSTATDNIRVIAFDCYGTIMRFAEAEFVEAFGEVCQLQALPVDGKTLWEKWLEAGRTLGNEAAARLGYMTSKGQWPEAVEPEFIPYRVRWPRYFHYALNGLGHTLDAEAAYDHVRQRLACAVTYPEVKDVLAALEGRYRMVLLSNADDDFLLPCLEYNSLSHAFEHIVSSEAARSYKPRPGIFEHLIRLLDVEPGAIAYVGDSPRSDVGGAKDAGLLAIWIDRYQFDPSKWPEGVPQPDYRIEDLTGLLPLFLPTAERGGV